MRLARVRREQDRRVLRRDGGAGGRQAQDHRHRPHRQRAGRRPGRGHRRQQDPEAHGGQGPREGHPCAQQAHEPDPQAQGLRKPAKVIPKRATFWG